MSDFLLRDEKALKKFGDLQSTRIFSTKKRCDLLMQSKNYSISDTFCALCVKWPTLPPPLFGVFLLAITSQNV